MEANFWIQLWEQNDIGFHEGKPNSLLVEFYDHLSLNEGSRFFLPLCGKAFDIGWLLSKGCHVIGSELSQVAIEQLFDELGVQPLITEEGPIKRFSAENIDMLVGDIFELKADMLGPVDCVYDRAALVALPEGVRIRYAVHLMAITQAARQLLITFEYDQSQMDGPPFSISRAEIAQHYGVTYETRLLKSQQMPGGVKGKTAADEMAWLLTAT